MHWIGSLSSGDALLTMTVYDGFSVFGVRDPSLGLSSVTLDAISCSCSRVYLGTESTEGINRDRWHFAGTFDNKMSKAQFNAAFAPRHFEVTSLGKSFKIAIYRSQTEQTTGRNQPCTLLSSQVKVL